MKLFKKTIFSLLSMALLATGFVACSSDDGTTTDVTTENVEVNSITSFSHGLSVDDFLENYYKGESFMIGRTVSTEDVDGKYEILEVILDKNPNRVGYVAIPEESNNVLYFIDKDLNTNTLYALNVKTNESDIYTDINKDEDFEFLNKFDFIYIVNLRNEYVGNNVTNSNMTTFGGISGGGGGVTIYERRFSLQKIWSNNRENCSDPYKEVDENLNVTCWKNCTYTSHRFFFKTKETSMKVPAEGC